MKSLKKSGLITFLSSSVIFIVGFPISIILARVLGPIDRGIYALIILIPTVMLKLSSLGIGTANIYFTGNKQYEIKDLISNSFISAILLSTINLLLFLGVSRLVIFQNFLNSNQINPLYLWLAILSTPFSLLFGFLLNIILGREEIVRFNHVSIIKLTFYLVAVIGFVLILKQGVLGATISYVLTAIFATLLIIFLLRRDITTNISLNKNLFKNLTRYGLKSYFGNLAQFLNYRLDMFLVAIFLTPADLGFYTIAVGIGERVWMFPGAFATVLFPRVSSIENGKSNKLTPKVARHTFLITFIVSLMLAIFAKHLINILYGSDFLPSVTPIVILLPGIIALGGAKILSADLAGRGKPQFGTYAAFVSLAVNIPLNLYFIPKWGISGAALASTVAYISASLFVLIAFTKISRVPFRDTLFIKLNDFKAVLNIN
ncbi:flippase [Thermodesulfobacteriota bacterium]